MCNQRGQFAYHAGHLDGYEGIDKIGLVGSLVAVPALAIVTSWAGWSSPVRKR